MTDSPDKIPKTLPPETRERLVELEERRERVCLRRTALPVAFGVVGVAAVVLFREEMFGANPGNATYAWMAFFWVGSLIGLSLNELTARRCMRKIQDEFMTIVSPEEEDEGE
jgi:hypothetical protein